MLLQLAKELVICGDFTSHDVFFYYTTTGSSMVRCCGPYPDRDFFRLDDVELPRIGSASGNDSSLI